MSIIFSFFVFATEITKPKFSFMKRNYISLATCLVFVLVLFSFFISCNNNSESTATANTGNEDSVKKVIDRGKYLAHHVALCMDCHSQRDFNQFSGPPVDGTEGMGGEAIGEKLGVPGTVYTKKDRKSVV